MFESCRFVLFSTDDMFCASSFVDESAIFVSIAAIITWVFFWDFLAFSIPHCIMTKSQSMSEFNFFSQKKLKIISISVMSATMIVCLMRISRSEESITPILKTCCHEMWLLIILRVRKSCINDRTIAKIMIICEEFYSKDVMWSVLRYNICSDHSHILIWEWFVLIELIWWFQSLSRNSIIIRTGNFIINWRLNDSTYLSIKSVVNTYIYHKKMKYWSHTKNKKKRFHL
jgi:hypothetical protein